MEPTREPGANRPSPPPWNRDESELLYRLSLAVGQSLDPVSTCESFLRPLIDSGRFDYGAVWVHEAYLPGGEDERRAVLLCELPERDGPRTIERSHPQHVLLEDRPFVCVPGDKAPALFRAVTLEPGITEGGWVIYPLGPLGILKLHAPTCPTEVPVEACARLLPVVQKFATALGNALAHARLEHDTRLREQAERELRASQERVRRLERMQSLGTMASGVAHDFNNVLANILGHATLLTRKLDRSHPLYAYAEAIRKSAEHASELTSRLLAFARPSPPPCRRVDLNAVVRDAASMLERNLGANIALELDLAPSLPAVCGDRTQLQQIVLNLCLNARDAMPEGGRLRIETAEETIERGGAELPPGRYTVLRVRDTGQGMAPETIEHIFEPFFTTKGAGEGTGLGLALVYAAVQNHRGHIAVDSRPGTGSVFTVYLPAMPEGAASDEDDPPGASAAEPGTDTAAGDAAPSAGSDPRATLLVVDDDPSVRLLLRELLEEEGYEVREAANGIEACERFAADPQGIDLVILDMMMPELGGAETIERLRQIDPAVRVLVSTGYTDAESSGELRQLDTCGFIAKPYRIEELLDTVQRVLADRTPRRCEPAHP